MASCVLDTCTEHPVCLFPPEDAMKFSDIDGKPVLSTSSGWLLCKFKGLSHSPYQKAARRSDTLKKVLDALKGLGVEGIEEIALPEDPKVEGKIKGSGFVEFGTHIDARAAFNHVAKPDAVLGCEFSANASFAEFPGNHSGESVARYHQGVLQLHSKQEAQAVVTEHKYKDES